jgi:hypothetical protein
LSLIGRTAIDSQYLSVAILRPTISLVHTSYRAMHNVTGGKAVKPFKM